MDRQPAVYILASRRNGTLYIGVTSNLPARAWHHRTNAIASFTQKYGVHDLVYFEIHGTMYEAAKSSSRNGIASGRCVS
jgi:putative endonuclease